MPCEANYKSWYPRFAVSRARWCSVFVLPRSLVNMPTLFSPLGMYWMTKAPAFLVLYFIIQFKIMLSLSHFTNHINNALITLIILKIISSESHQSLFIAFSWFFIKILICAFLRSSIWLSPPLMSIASAIWFSLSSLVAPPIRMPSSDIGPWPYLIVYPIYVCKL